MKKSTIIWICIAAGLCIAGLIVALVGLFMMSFDFKDADFPKYDEKSYQVSGDFNKISIDTETSDVIFVRSQDGVCRVDCSEIKRLTYSVYVEDGTLTIEKNDSRKWYDHITIFNFTRTMTVHLPAEKYDAVVINSTTGDVSVPEDFSFSSAKVELTTGDIKWGAQVSEELSAKTTTGDISVSGISPKKLDVKASTGQITLSDIKCESAKLKSTTGDNKLKNVVAKALNIESSTGDITLRDCDGESISVKTTTGDVEAALLSGKNFSTSTSTGNVRVPSDSEGGSCRIETTTGDIRVKIAE